MPSIAATSFVLETEFRHKSSRTSFQLRADVSTGYFSQHVPGVTNISKAFMRSLALNQNDTMLAPCPPTVNVQFNMPNFRANRRVFCACVGIVNRSRAAAHFLLLPMGPSYAFVAYFQWRKVIVRQTD